MRCSRSSWRIRLAAYVARLERGLGAIPQGFKSPILRKLTSFSLRWEAGFFTSWVKCLGLRVLVTDVVNVTPVGLRIGFSGLCSDIHQQPGLNRAVDL